MRIGASIEPDQVVLNPALEGHLEPVLLADPEPASLIEPDREETRHRIPRPRELLPRAKTRVTRTRELERRVVEFQIDRVHVQDELVGLVSAREVNDDPRLVHLGRVRRFKVRLDG